MRRQLILATIAAASAACATTPQPAATTAAPAPAAAPAPVPHVAAEALVDHSGDSPETAIDVPADAQNEGIDFQNNWIYDRFGRFRRTGGGIAHAGEGSATRRYEVVEIELPDHSKHTVYFDITENEKNWAAQRKARKAQQPSPQP